jgi:hypothetical protein
LGTVGNLEPFQKSWSNPSDSIRQRGIVPDRTFHRVCEEKASPLEGFERSFFADFTGGVRARASDEFVEIVSRIRGADRTILGDAIEIIFGTRRRRGVEQQNLDVYGTQARRQLQAFDSFPDVPVIGGRATTVAKGHGFSGRGNRTNGTAKEHSS